MSNPAVALGHIHILSQPSHAAARWYVQRLGADMVAGTVARGASQSLCTLAGKTQSMQGQ